MRLGALARETGIPFDLLAEASPTVLRAIEERHLEIVEAIHHQSKGR